VSSLAHPAALVGGLALVVFTLVDAIGTLVAARGLTARWRPTRQFYWLTWRLWRAVARRLMGRRQESFFSGYAPLTLLALLGMWLVGRAGTRRLLGPFGRRRRGRGVA